MCITCKHDEFAQRLGEMIDDGNYDFAEEWLTSTKRWVEMHQHCTDKQKSAADNIENGGNRFDDIYEG